VKFSRQLRYIPVLVLTISTALAASGSLFAQDTGSAVFTEPDASVVTPAQAQALRQPAIASPVGEPNAALDNSDVTMTAKPVSDIPRKLQYEISGTVRGVWDDNIFNSSFHKVSDFYFTIEPSLHVGLGGGDSDSVNTLTFTYQPSVFLFVDNDQNDAVQHLIQLAVGHRFGHLALSLSQDVRLLDGTDLNSLSDPTGHQANTDVSGRNRHQIYTTQLSGSYDLTGKLFLSGGGNFYADEYSGSLISSQNYGGNVYLNYIYSDKLVVGFGGTGGYNTVNGSGANNQVFEQANVRLNYSATAKISVSATAGAEFRQFSGVSGSEINPVYTLSASYTPFDGTAISLTGSSQTYNSASFTGQDYSETTINLSVTQRFMQRFFLGFAVGYTNSSYFSAAQGVTATRNDDFYYIDPSIDFNVTRYWTFGAYYVHREDTSSFAFFSFKDNQVGIRTRLTF
jgi:hypothetical protein